VDSGISGRDVIAAIKQRYQLKPLPPKEQPKSKVAVMDVNLDPTDVIASIKKKYKLSRPPAGKTAALSAQNYITGFPSPRPPRNCVFIWPTEWTERLQQNARTMQC